MRACGRHFDPTLIGRIQAAVDAEPGMSRRALSRQVCKWMQWVSPKGKLQDMSCRKALGKLADAGLLRLPEITKEFAFRRTPDPTPPATVERSAALEVTRATLADLGPLELVIVEGRTSEAFQWRQLLEQHHYLGAGPLCGAQIRYLVRSAAHGAVGALAFSSATWKLAKREAYIGWSERARQENLHRVILNSRFLITPALEVPNLASHVLGLVLRQVASDWHARYGVEPVLVETFVDPARHAATGYRAANWIGIGQTAARQVPYANGKLPGGPKDIYVYPLGGDWPSVLSVLCREPERRLSTGRPYDHPPEDWAEEELGRADWADPRLKIRAIEIARRFMAQPGKPIPQTCTGDPASAAATYRFFDNAQVDLASVLFPHRQATVERIRAHKVVLAAQDTTDLDFTHHPKTTGMGPLQSIDDLTVGLKLHDTMAFTVEGVPLGLVDVQCWARDGSTAGQKSKRRRLPIEEKESFKWIRSFRSVAEVQRLAPDTTLVSVGDREADLFELFQEALADPAGPKLLVRAEKTRSRKLDRGEQAEDEPYGYLWEHMARRPVASFPKVVVPANGNRTWREATVAVRFDAVKIKPPKGTKGEPSAIWAVYSHEVDYDPLQIKEPLSWMLLTTVPTTTAEQAEERLEWYTKRWGIEIYHRTLKSGCKIQDRRLDDADRLEACLAIDMLVAWRVHSMVYLGREDPNLPCDIILEEGEWKAAYVLIHDKPPPDKPPPLSEGVWLIGKLGGHLGPLGGAPPGPMTIWRGLCRAHDLGLGWRLRDSADRPARPP